MVLNFKFGSNVIGQVVSLILLNVEAKPFVQPIHVLELLYINLIIKAFHVKVLHVMKAMTKPLAVKVTQKNACILFGRSTIFEIRHV